MENQPTTQPTNPKSFSTLTAVVVAVIVTAVVVGGGVYLWQAAQLKTAQENLVSVQQQIAVLQSQIAQLGAVSVTAPETAAPQPETAAPQPETAMPQPETVPPQPETYTNQAYGFSLTFPISWGKIKAEQVTDTGYAKISAFRLTSENDSERWVQINIVRIEDKNDPYVLDYPQTFIKDSNLWAFYYISGGDNAGAPGMEDQKYFDIAEEVRQIIQTFTLR